MNNQIVGQERNITILNTAIERNMPVLIIGETGTGKTELIKQLASQSNASVIRYNITGETTIDEILGRYELIGGETHWQDGIVVQAMKTGAWLLMDEVNLALPEVIMALQSLLDDSRELRIAQHHGESVKPADSFRFFATMNPTEGYAGTKPLNRAFLSRYPIVINVNYPERKDEVSILQEHGLSAEEAQTVMDIALTTRHLKKLGELNYQISTRELIQYATLRQFMPDTKECLELAIINKAQGDEQGILTKIAEDVLADYKAITDEFGFTPTIQTLKKAHEDVKLEQKNLELQRAQMKEELAKELLSTINAPKAGK